MLLVIWTLAWLFLQINLSLCIPQLYDNIFNNKQFPWSQRHQTSWNPYVYNMNTPVMLTPGFSSLVFEFWRFDFGCISFGTFQIRIRDADYSDHDVSKETINSLCATLCWLLCCALFWVISSSETKGWWVASGVLNSSKLFQKDLTITPGSPQDDGITYPDPDHQNGINAPCIILVVLYLNIGLPSSFFQFCIYHHTLYQAKDESKRQHNSPETSFLGFCVT